MIIFKLLSYFFLVFASLPTTLLKYAKQGLAIAERDDILQVLYRKPTYRRAQYTRDTTGHYLHLSFPREVESIPMLWGVEEIESFASDVYGHSSRSQDHPLH